MKHLILIAGKAESGKDTFAKLVKANFNNPKRIAIIHYADILKYLATQYFGWSGEKDVEGRALLQHVGDVIRKNNPNYLIDQVLNLIRTFENEWDVVLVPDARFPIELSAPKDAFPNVNVETCIMRRSAPNSLTEEQRAHKTETAFEVFDFDNEIDNNGTYEELFETAAFYASTLSLD